MFWRTEAAEQHKATAVSYRTGRKSAAATAISAAGGSSRIGAIAASWSPGGCCQGLSAGRPARAIVKAEPRRKGGVQVRRPWLDLGRRSWCWGLVLFFLLSSCCLLVVLVAFLFSLFSLFFLFFLLLGWVGLAGCCCWVLLGWGAT